MILVLILTFKAGVITAIAKGDLKMFKSEQDSFLTSAIPVQSIQ